MKRVTLVLFIFPILFTAKGQNLVPNGDFEQYSGCPNGLSQLDSALFWFNPSTATPDYFNQCSTSAVSVPVNFLGYQQAHSGVGYAGIIIFTQPPFILNQRENIEVPLVSSLVANSCYHFEMYMNRGNNCQYATDDIGVYFSDTVITGINNLNPLPFTPQINNSTGYITDTLNWILVSINYTATGGENYLIIGNFKDDANTTAIHVNPGATISYAYYYIDDVSLTHCTGTNEFGTENSELGVYPNPAGDELTINIPDFQNLEYLKLTIKDILGKEVLKSIPIHRDNNQSSIINIQSLQSGIYFIEINDGKKVRREKFVKK